MIYVYKLTFPSGKYYIGITNNYYKRWSDHICLARSAKSPNQVYKAIKKYSPENVLWEIIDIAENYDTAHELERRYILHFNSYKEGYNATLGGDGVSKWTKDNLKLEAKKYIRKIDFKQYSYSAYVILNSYRYIDSDFYNSCTSHFTNNVRKSYKKKWSIDRIIEEVRKYSSLKEIRYSNTPLYTALGRLRRTNAEMYDKILSLTV